MDRNSPPQFPFYSTVLKYGRQRSDNSVDRGSVHSPRFQSPSIRYENRDLLDLGSNLQWAYVPPAQVPPFASGDYITQNMSTLQRLIRPQDYRDHPLERELPGYVSGNHRVFVPENTPIYIVENFPGYIPDNYPVYLVPVNQPQNIPQNIPTFVPECNPGNFPERNPGHVPERMPGHLPERIPERSPGNYPEPMSPYNPFNVQNQANQENFELTMERRPARAPFYSTVVKYGRRRRGGERGGNGRYYTGRYYSGRFLARGDFYGPRYVPFNSRIQSPNPFDFASHVQRDYNSMFAQIPRNATEQWVNENIATVQRLVCPYDYNHPLSVCQFCGFVGYNYPLGPREISIDIHLPPPEESDNNESTDPNDMNSGGESYYGDQNDQH
ncbi:hypothetical protein TcasGA2_TC031463 [Tribolium castaneum]|uniref:Uncharacterized protein n=1 Tax=Tribolium castaneum TaxID=7070 RepID=A0A139WPM6_TRICA|nr:hypothetical protein TcasGA2_TC031463 [Tribolium castaneum]